MDITLEQARALKAVAETGSFAKAAELLGKRHSAIIYAVKCLEEQTELQLLDRSQYRSSLTYEGSLVLQACRQLLEAEKNLLGLCRSLRAGWEPSLKIIYEAPIPTSPILTALAEFATLDVPTQIQFHSANQREIGTEFLDLTDKIIFSLQRPQGISETFSSLPLSPFNVCLVGSPSIAGSLSSANSSKLLEYDGFSGFSAFPEAKEATIHFDNIQTMIDAITAGVGVGWVPEHMLTEKLADGALKILAAENAVQTLFPRVYFHRNLTKNRAARLLLDKIEECQNTPDCAECGRKAALNSIVAAEKCSRTKRESEMTL